MSKNNLVATQESASQVATQENVNNPILASYDGVEFVVDALRVDGTVAATASTHQVAEKLAKSKYPSEIFEFHARPK